MGQVCLHLIVRGRVQGVWYRRFVQEQARSNRVGGWVRNCADGSVEALLCGDERSVRHVEAWLAQGPELAKVTEIAVQQQPYEPVDGFVIREDGD